MSRARVIHTGQGVADIVLRIPALPEAGGDVFASRHEVKAGGGVNTMVAAARDGAQVVHTGAHGTGPFGDLVRAALAAEDIELLSEPDPERDTGFCVALIDDHAERTFLSTTGAEAHASLTELEAAAPRAGDVVCASGYSLVHDDNREALTAWIPTLPPGSLLVVDPAPVIGDVDPVAVDALLSRADVWTTNAREARVLLGRLDNSAPDRDPAVIAHCLAETSRRVIVLRAGALGAFIAKPGRDVVGVPSIEVTAVDTNGAGDAHTGVLCARLAAGSSLEAAVERANAAAAIAVTRPGPATAPTTAELDQVLRGLSRSPRGGWRA